MFGFVLDVPAFGEPCRASPVSSQTLTLAFPSPCSCSLPLVRRRSLCWGLASRRACLLHPPELPGCIWNFRSSLFYPACSFPAAGALFGNEIDLKVMEMNRDRLLLLCFHPNANSKSCCGGGDVLCLGWLVWRAGPGPADHFLL